MHIYPFLAKILNKLHLLQSFNGSAKIIINGKKIDVPLLGRLGYDNLNLSEPWMSDMLIALRPLFNGHFIDVGVNIGQTLLKAQTVFEKVNYIGFEPNPSCVNYVQELIRINGFKNSVLFPIAIGATTIMLKLNFFSEDKGDSSATLIENFKENTQPDHFIFVPVFDLQRIRQFLPEEHSSILKIDVEGAELEVLFALQEWIQTFHPMILLEILPVYSEKNRSRLEKQRKIEEQLRIWNYKVARIKKRDPVQIEFIETIGIHSKIEDCDYLLIHNSQKQAISNCFKN